MKLHQSLDILTEITDEFPIVSGYINKIWQWRSIGISPIYEILIKMPIPIRSDAKSKVMAYDYFKSVMNSQKNESKISEIMNSLFPQFEGIDLNLINYKSESTYGNTQKKFYFTSDDEIIKPFVEADGRHGGKLNKFIHNPMSEFIYGEKIYGIEDCKFMSGTPEINSESGINDVIKNLIKSSYRNEFGAIDMHLGIMLCLFPSPIIKIGTNQFFIKDLKDNKAYLEPISERLNF